MIVQGCLPVYLKQPGLLLPRGGCPQQLAARPMPQATLLIARYQSYNLINLAEMVTFKELQCKSNSPWTFCMAASKALTHTLATGEVKGISLLNEDLTSVRFERMGQNRKLQF